MSWKIVKNKTKDHWMEAEYFDGSGVYVGKVLEQLPVSRAICKWDGCIHYYDCDLMEEELNKEHEHNDNCQYLHIDDIDKFIKEMQQLQKLGQDFFRDKPNGDEYYR